MKSINTWYAKTTNTGSPHEQGLIIDETTGANIAVSYDAKHAPLLASAPDLLAALEDARDFIMENSDDGGECNPGFIAASKAISAAIAKATA